MIGVNVPRWSASCRLIFSSLMVCDGRMMSEWEWSYFLQMAASIFVKKKKGKAKPFPLYLCPHPPSHHHHHQQQQILCIVFLNLHYFILHFTESSWLVWRPRVLSVWKLLLEPRYIAIYLTLFFVSDKDRVHTHFPFCPLLKNCGQYPPRIVWPPVPFTLDDGHRFYYYFVFLSLRVYVRVSVWLWARMSDILILIEKWCELPVGSSGTPPIVVPPTFSCIYLYSYHCMLVSDF